MSIFGYTGAAGTGKTTRLMTELSARLISQPLVGDQRVLALTRMHGSRHRLINRLSVTSARRRFDCLTFDRFAWELTSRWRSRLREVTSGPLAEFDYDATCDAAARLLSDACITEWVRARYPVVIVDEFQDCRAGRLKIVQALASRVDLLVAADDFQDLEHTGPSDALEWLRRAARVEDLTTVHRTSESALLDAAKALRSGLPLRDGSSFKVFGAPNASVAASFLARGITWSGGQEVVVISAAGETSPFVRDAFARLAAKPFEKAGKKFGPFLVGWEQSREGLLSDLCERLGLPNDADAGIYRPRFAPGAKLPAQREIEQWIEIQHRLRGDVPIRCAELRSRVQRCVQQLRSQPRRVRGPRAMTIHQAKNREFDRVLILWPVTVPGDVEKQRRLLYNAVTRAKKAATIIVQDPKPTSSRLVNAPFQ